MRLIDADALLYELHDIYESCLDNADRLETSIYLDGLVRAIKTIYPAPTVMQWVSVDTELPPDGRILIASKGGKVHIGTVTLTDGNDMFCSIEYNQQPLLHKVAHWMPLPSLPDNQQAQ